MVDFDIKAFQHKCLEIMDVFDALCRKQDLRYYLACGTMLGAVRHKGFIPWDDDVDVYMPRPDYEVLAKNYKQWLPGHLNLVNCDTDITFPHYFAKLEDINTSMIERIYLGHYGGIWIDIFPIDGAAPNKVAQWIHNMRFKVLRKLLYYRYRDPWKHGKTLGGYIILLVHNLFTKEYLHRRLQNLIKQYDFNKSEVLMPHNDGMKTFTKTVLGERTEYDFEGRKYWGVKDYDAYLTKIYGDYMTPPPIEEQVVHHNLVFCDLNMPYSEYVQRESKKNQDLIGENLNPCEQ